MIVLAFLTSSLAQWSIRVQSRRTDEDIRETRRRLASKRDPRRGEWHGRVIGARISVGKREEEVSDHLEKLIDDIEISTAQDERSQTGEFCEEIPHTFTRRHDSNSKWSKARIRKHKHTKSPNPNGITNIRIFTNKTVSNLKKQNENNMRGQVQTKSQSVSTENQYRQPLGLNQFSHSPINQEDLFRISRKMLKIFNSESKYPPTY